VRRQVRFVALLELRRLPAVSEAWDYVACATLAANPFVDET
jgi:hypothetical protein